MANSGFISPVLTELALKVRPHAPGSPATMPERISIEMPLPTPRSVICSPSHIRNMVPVVIVIVAGTSQSKNPLALVMPPLPSATAAPKDWNSARPTVT